MINFNLNSFLERYDHICILIHIRPDGDAIGSALALARALKQKEKNVKLYCADVIPSKYSFLPGIEGFQESFEPTEEEELIFVLDCSDLGRLGYLQERILNAGIMVNIDHHITNERFGDYNVVDSSASATAEIIYRLLLESGLNIDDEISLCLYVGISSDTGSFKHENTSPQAMYIAAKLLERGVSPFLVSQKIFDELSVPGIMLLRDALATLTFDDSQKIAWLKISDEMLARNNAKPEELDGFVDYAKNIKGIEVGMLFYFKENKKETKVGLRSKKINVAQVAKAFDGGGHPRAAGCTIWGNQNEAVGKLLGEVQKVLKGQILFPG